MTSQDPFGRERASGGSERQELLDDLLRFSDQLILRLDAAGRIDYLNEPLAAALGVEAAEARGRPYLSFVHPAERESTREAFDRLRAAPHALRDFQQRVIAAGGDRILSWSLRALLDAAGSVRAIQAVGLDVTELRRVLDELREEHDLALELLEHLPVGVLVLEATTFRVASHNRRCLDWLAPEVSRWPLVGRGMDELLSDGSSRNRVLALLRDALRRKTPRGAEDLVLPGPDTLRRRWTWRVTPLLAPGGGAVRRLLVVTEPVSGPPPPGNSIARPTPGVAASVEDDGILEPVQVPESSELPRGDETILLVDDDAMVLDVAAQILADQGYTVIKAGRGEEALALARSHRSPIHLLVTDVVMPGMDGRQLAERMRRLSPDMPVLFISGYADSVFSQGDLEDPGVRLLRKPFTIMALAQRIRTILDGADRAAGPSAGTPD